MRLVKTVTAMDLAAIVRDPGYVLDPARVHRYRKAIRDGDEFPPVAISNTGCRLLDGEHRLEAFKQEGRETHSACVYEPESIRDARIHQLQVNKDRRSLTPEETAELVQLLAEREAEKQQELKPDHDAPRLNSETNSPNSKSAKTRGRKKTNEGKAVDRVARDEGVTPAAIRKRVKKAKEQENTDPVSAELLKPPPSLAVRMGRALVDLRSAAEKLEGVLKDMEGELPRFGEQDGRHAVIGQVASAVRSSRSAFHALEQAREFMTKMNTAKFSPPTGAKHPPLPVKPGEVRVGKQLYERSKADMGPPVTEKPAADQEAEPTVSDPARVALARSEFARQEMVAREEQPEREPQSTTPEGDPPPPISKAQAARERRAAERAAAEDAANGTPRTGLGGAKLNVVLERDGQEIPYEQALAEADSAGVAGGPPEDGDIPW